MYIKIYIESLPKNSLVHAFVAGALGMFVGLSLGTGSVTSFGAWVTLPSERSSVVRTQSVSYAVALHEAAPDEPYAVPSMPYAVPPIPQVLLSLSSASSSFARPSDMEPVASSSSSTAPRSIISSSSAASASAASSLSSVPVVDASVFPAFGNAVHPVARVPNWGAMTVPAQWNRTYAEMTDDDYVAIPRYDLSRLTVPLSQLLQTRNDPATISLITAKLYYSTRFFGKYDLDAGEFTGIHPGVDLKLPVGTPIGAVAGGRVLGVRSAKELGTYVIIEHRHPSAGTFYSIYGHLGATRVVAGQDVTSGQVIGVVGMTGNTSAPHLHLQIDRGIPGDSAHQPYLPEYLPSPAEAEIHVVSPIKFIAQY